MANSGKVLARAWLFAINTGTTQTPTWTTINGINTHSWSHDKKDADTTTYDDAGWMTHMAASRGASLKLGGYRIEDESTGVRDTGQAALETLGTQMGQASLKQFKITTPGGNTITGMASANAGGTTGGGNDDPTGWEAELTFSGALTLTPKA